MRAAAPMAGLACLMMSACQLFRPPAVFVIDSRTALENQVVGQYEPLSDDLLLSASLPGVARRALAERAGQQVADEAELARVRDAQERLVEALLSQEYNRDDLDRFRREGWLGEGATGALHVFADRIETLDPRLRKRVHLLAEEENRDRQSLVEAVIEISPTLGPGDRTEIEQVFARQYFSQVPAGGWVERPAGHWQELAGPPAAGQGR